MGTLERTFANATSKLFPYYPLKTKQHVGQRSL